MYFLKSVMITALAAASCLAAVVPRTIMHNSVATMKAFKELKPTDKPFLIGPGPSFEEEDLDNLEKLGCKYLGTFTVKSKEAQQKPKGETLDHHIMNMPEDADKDGAFTYLMRRKLNWVFDLRIPKTTGNVIDIHYGPRGIDGLPEDDEKVRWIKPEDRVITNCDQEGPTSAFYQDIKTPDVELRVITSSYPKPGFLNENTADVMHQLRKWETDGWFLLGTSRERLLLFSAPPKGADKTWLGSLSGFASSFMGGGESQWERTAARVFEEVKSFVPYFGPVRVPFNKVPYYSIGGKLLTQP